jgi:hypothetical protein
LIQYGAWSAYSGFGAFLLAFVLFVVTIILAFLALRLPQPIALKRPSRVLGIMLGVIWFLSLCSFVTSAVVYGMALVQQIGPYNAPANPVTPVTLIAAGLACFTIVYLTQRSGFVVAVGSAIIGAIVGWMIFELPFDLIVMWRTFPPKPQTTFTLLFFLPLMTLEITSYALVTLLPSVRITRSTLMLLAGLFLVFAIWAVFGFPYPETSLPIGLNMIGKVIAFAIAISLFLPPEELAPWRPVQTPGKVESELPSA